MSWSQSYNNDRNGLNVWRRLLHTHIEYMWPSSFDHLSKLSHVTLFDLHIEYWNFGAKVVFWGHISTNKYSTASTVHICSTYVTFFNQLPWLCHATLRLFSNYSLSTMPTKEMLPVLNEGQGLMAGSRQGKTVGRLPPSCTPCLDDVLLQPHFLHLWKPQTQNI